MKRIFILFAAVALVAAGCKNYDDRFDDLNSQITALNTQVTALQGLDKILTTLRTDIENIRSDIEENIKTEVANAATPLASALNDAEQLLEDLKKGIDEVSAGISKTVSDEVAKVKNELNAEIKKLEDALNQAAGGTQDEIKKLQQGLEAAQAALTAINLTEIETQLGAIQKELDEAQKATLSPDDLITITNKIDALEDQLEKTLKESRLLVQTDVSISNTGTWLVAQSSYADATRFGGNLHIHTADLSADEKKAIADWVKNITLITGTLEIRHTDKENVIKFESLASVGTLNDTQPHVHYPELTEAREVILNVAKNKVLTVKLPKLASTTFAGNEIHLPNATDISIGLTKHSFNDDLEIKAKENTTKIALDLLTVIDTNGSGGGTGNRKLIINGADVVSLAALRTIYRLEVKNTNSLIAPKVKGTILEIKADVDAVNVGTADDSHIKGIFFTGATDLETLQIGGSTAAPKKDGTGGTYVNVSRTGQGDVSTTPNLERAHIHGAWGVRINDLEDFEEIVTARTIPRLYLIKTDVEGEVVLGHESGAGSILQIVDNEDLEILIADKINKLKNLVIQGNVNLERISFAALKEGSPQEFDSNSVEWWLGDAVVIGGSQFDGNPTSSQPNKVGNYDLDDRNNLLADVLHLAVGTDSPQNQRQPGKIEDSSGLSGLKDFLSHENIRRAVVSYDGASTFKPDRTKTYTLVANPEQVKNKSGNDFVLIRKGLRTATRGAIRGFIIPIDSGSPGSVTVNIGTINNPVALQTNSSPANWVNVIQKAERESNFYDINDVTLEAKVGGNPRGTITFAALDDPDDDIEFDEDRLSGNISLTIGEDKNTAITSTVVVQKVDRTPDDDSDNQGTVPKLRGNVDFSPTNRTAITYIADDDNGTVVNDQTAHIDNSAIRNALLRPFTQLSGDTQVEDRKTGKPVVPYGVNAIDGDNAATIGTLDAQAIDKPIKVTIGGRLSRGWDLKVTATSISNSPNTIQIKLTSQVAGDNESTIGQPPEGTDALADFQLPGGNTATEDAYISSPAADVDELPVSGWRASSLPRLGSDVDTGGGDKDQNRLGWIN
ncbi:MAG: hypothetical protein OXC92_03810 [Flavobacteriaceae bacterium]|nr:hypothetical protein [Flavobacteriaceae bacterium]